MQSPAEDAASAAGNALYTVNCISHVETGGKTPCASCAMSTELGVPAEQGGN